jgi:hypothetical protein
MHVNASFCISQTQPRALHPHVNRGSNSLQFDATLPHCICPSLTARIHMLQRSCAPAFAKAPIQRLPACIVPSVEHPPSYNQSPAQFRITPSRGRGSAVIYMSRLSGFYDITSCRLHTYVVAPHHFLAPLRIAQVPVVRP